MASCVAGLLIFGAESWDQTLALSVWVFPSPPWPCLSSLCESLMLLSVTSFL